MRGTAGASARFASASSWPSTPPSHAKVPLPRRAVVDGVADQILLPKIGAVVDYALIFVGVALFFLTGKERTN